MRRRLVLLVLLVGLACLPAATASASYFAVRGAPAPGPAKYDRVWVETFGPSRAPMVLVLIPGTSGGVGSVAPVARDLVARVRGLQVWAIDRRPQAFEDGSRFEGGDLQRAHDYYLGLHWTRPAPADVPFVADWGLEVSVEDVRRVVLKARAGGRRKLVLGGHSRGASTAAAYAAWDFDGRPGYRDVAGLVLIDGGLLGSITVAGDDSQIAEADARAQLASIRGGDLFNDNLGNGIPSAGPVFLELLALYASKQPSAPSALQQEAIVPATLKPPFRVTNEAFLGRIFDKETSPPNFASLRLNAGMVAPEGDPRAWVSGERTPLQRFARAFSREPRNATEWYFPRRLILDVSAANPMRRDAVSDLLGLRLFHTARIDTPLYAFQTDLTGGRVLRGAQRLVDRSRIKRKRLVDDEGMSHLDPVLAPPATNTFTRTVVPFLRGLR